MIKLQEVPFSTVSRYFIDFQKKSRCFEFPPETAQYVGIYSDTKLIGYFILQAYDSLEMEINQGYLIKEFRHASLPKICMEKLEEICKQAGYRKMLLGTHNRFKSYLKFAATLGFKPKQLIFEKDLGE